jgi:hypothetical protein
MDQHRDELAERCSGLNVDLLLFTALHESLPRPKYCRGGLSLALAEPERTLWWLQKVSGIARRGGI